VLWDASVVRASHFFGEILMMNFRSAAWCGLLCGACFSVQAKADESQDIRALISKQFDRPHATVRSNPIVIEQDFAVLDWAQGKKGGRALLQKKNAEWEILLCAGEALKHAKTIQSAGVPTDIANTLADKLIEEESSLSAVQVKQFDRFKEVSTQHKKHHQ
jgi:hypothetical protein